MMFSKKIYYENHKYVLKELIWRIEMMCKRASELIDGLRIDGTILCTISCKSFCRTYIFIQIVKQMNRLNMFSQTFIVAIIMQGVRGYRSKNAFPLLEIILSLPAHIINLFIFETKYSIMSKYQHHWFQLLITNKSIFFKNSVYSYFQFLQSCNENNL